MFNFRKKLGMGYIEDKKDSRDYDITDYKPLKSTLKFNADETSHIIDIVDFTPIKDQGRMGSCTAHAGAALMEYYIKRVTGKDYDLSEKYLYWVTRKLLGWENKDTGAYLRTTMQALTRFGICEERFFPYSTNFVESPDWVQAALADDFRAETYMRLDKSGMSKEDVLTKIKKLISRNYPIQFGFTVFKNTIDNRTGNIFYPANGQRNGGHAVVIVGYDDDKSISNQKGSITTTGAFKIRNSWGDTWGDNGYGWLPYEYLLQGEARDFWMMFRADWVKLEKFN